MNQKSLSKMERILALLIELDRMPGQTTRHLAERFGVSRRTIFRDMRTLSIIGVPVAYSYHEDAVRKINGYELVPGFAPPSDQISGKALQQFDVVRKQERIAFVGYIRMFGIENDELEASVLRGDHTQWTSKIFRRLRGVTSQ